MNRLLSALILALLLIHPAPSQDADGYRLMFTGKDLAGWVNVNCDPSTFFVKDNMIITTGKPTGFLRTDKQYENFVMEFDWMHQNKKDVGNSGLFVWGDPIPAVGTGYTRGIEVQVLVNLNVKDTYTSHGDLFSIWGAKCKPDRPHPKGWERCLPSENLCKGGGEWNHYKVTGNDGAIRLEVNGKEVSGVNQCNPRKGYLALESEDAECWFKNLEIKQLPSTNPRLDEIADVDKGFKTMYNGMNLNGWKMEDGHKGHWKPQGTRLTYDGKSEAEEKTLWNEKEYGNFEMIVDIKSSVRTSLEMDFPNGGIGIEVPLSRKAVANWKRMRVVRKDSELTIDSLEFPYSIKIREVAGNARIGLKHLDGPVEYANLFIRELK